MDLSFHLSCSATELKLLGVAIFAMVGGRVIIKRRPRLPPVIDVTELGKPTDRPALPSQIMKLLWIGRE
jgi:hypothetical protein